MATGDKMRLEMDWERYRRSLTAPRPPRGLAAPLRALWHEQRGEWARAHEIVSSGRSRAAMRVHAYLHRKEGDLANADYWYSRAGASRPRGSFAAEWESLVRELLNEP
jgi:hypothetical protein